MIGMIVSGHGHFASGLHVSAKMIAGEHENVRYIDFEDGMGPDKLGELLSAAYTELAHCDGIVVLTDLPGGAPFQTAVAASMQHPDQKIEVYNQSAHRVSQTHLAIAFAPFHTEWQN